MRIRVLDKNIEYNVDCCYSFMSQARGWMFRKNFSKDGLFFDFKRVKKVDLHTMFVYSNLDLIWLDPERKVVRIIRNVEPFRFRISGEEARFLLEVKDAGDLVEGDVLLF